MAFFSDMDHPPPTAKPFHSMLCGVPTLRVYDFPRAQLFPSPQNVCAMYPLQCSSVPLPHSTLSWILSKVDNLASYSLQPIHSDTWPQLNYQSSSTFISECGTPS